MESRQGVFSLFRMEKWPNISKIVCWQLSKYIFDLYLLCQEYGVEEVQNYSDGFAVGCFITLAINR